MVSIRLSFVRAIQVFVAALLLLWCTGAAHAHQSSYTYASATAEGTRLDYEIRLASSDLFEALGLKEDRDATDEEIVLGGEQLQDYVLERVLLEVPGQRCMRKLAPVRVVLDGQRFASVAVALHCPRAVLSTRVNYELFFDLDPRHEGLLRVDGGLVQLTSSSKTYEHTWGGQGPSSRLGFLRSGALHVLYGLDHILFLISLLVVIGLRSTQDGLRSRTLGESARGAAGVVSAFTLGHSLTLVAAALGWVSLPSQFVESMIAASIVYVAIENVFRPDPPRRYLVTLLFGLMHGLGFASMLRPLLSPEDLVVPLLVFNLGVEVGQLAVVVLALPLVLVLVRALGARRYARLVVPMTSAALSIAGLLWLAERALGL